MAHLFSYNRLPVEHNFVFYRFQDYKFQTKTIISNLDMHIKVLS